jgi:hypothetical protein
MDKNRFRNHPGPYCNSKLRTVAENRTALRPYVNLCVGPLLYVLEQERWVLTYELSKAVTNHPTVLTFLAHDHEGKNKNPSNVLGCPLPSSTYDSALTLSLFKTSSLSYVIGIYYWHQSIKARGSRPSGPPLNSRKLVKIPTTGYRTDLAKEGKLDAAADIDSEMHRYHQNLLGACLVLGGSENQISQVNHIIPQKVPRPPQHTADQN